MDTVPAGAVRRSVGGEVPMELTLVRATNRRFPLWIPLLLAFAFVLVASVPLAAGDGERPVAASMFVSRTQASPGDNVTFWIWVTPLKEQARNLIDGIQSHRVRGRVVRGPGFLSADTTHLGVRPGSTPALRDRGPCRRRLRDRREGPCQRGSSPSLGQGGASE